VQAKEDLIESLTSQRAALEGELLAATEKLEIACNAQASASQTEREAVVKAEADLKATIAEIEALKVAHAQATEVADSNTRDLERSTSRIEELEEQINGLKAEREENASKVSELEVEVLELRESQETLEDDRENALAKVKRLEEQISSLASAAKQAEEGARTKAAEFEVRVTELHSQHAEQLQIDADERAKVATSLESVQAQLEAAQRELEQGRTNAEAAAHSHLQKLKEAEDSFLAQKALLEGEIKTITSELEVCYTFAFQVSSC
jgi:conserved oligomeric Golgi complex subunit 6